MVFPICAVCACSLPMVHTGSVWNYGHRLHDCHHLCVLRRCSPSTLRHAPKQPQHHGRHVALAFFSSRVTVSLPMRLYEGVFLNAVVFLPFRFRPGAHSHVLVLFHGTWIWQWLQKWLPKYLLPPQWSWLACSLVYRCLHGPSTKRTVWTSPRTKVCVFILLLASLQTDHVH